jgi:hypothetical protein
MLCDLEENGVGWYPHHPQPMDGCQVEANEDMGPPIPFMVRKVPGGYSGMVGAHNLI